MQVKVKRIEKDLPLPGYQTAGAVAFDLYARTDTAIPPHEIRMIPTNTIIEVPAGYFLLVASRSSSPIKKGLMCANGIGVIDEDFHGEKDEINFLGYNFTNEYLKIKRGDRIGQVLLVKIEKAELVEVENMNAVSRGGFGSTG